MYIVTSHLGGGEFVYNECCLSLGMMLGGGCGKELAHWIIHGRPEKDMYGYDIRYSPLPSTSGLLESYVLCLTCMQE